MKKLQSLLAALSVCALSCATASAGNFSDSFDYAAGELESVSGGAWVYNNKYYNSLGNKMYANGSGAVTTSSNYYAGAGYVAPATADFYNGTVSAKFTLDSLIGGGGEVNVAARNQADGTSVGMSIFANWINPANDAGVNGEDTWYNLSIHVYGTDIGTNWVNTMARATDVYGGKEFGIDLEFVDSVVNAKFWMDKSNDYGATWSVAEHNFTGNITGAGLNSAGAVSIYSHNWGAPNAVHFNANLEDINVVVPEPASLALLGLGGLALLRRRH